MAGCSSSFRCAVQAISALKKRRPSFDFIGLPNYNQTLLPARLAHNSSVDMDSEDRQFVEQPARSRDDEPMLFCPCCNSRLMELKCKLICGKCGYYMSCADYY